MPPLPLPVPGKGLRKSFPVLTLLCSCSHHSGAFVVASLPGSEACLRQVLALRLRGIDLPLGDLSRSDSEDQVRPGQECRNIIMISMS